MIHAHKSVVASFVFAVSGALAGCAGDDADAGLEAPTRSHAQSVPMEISGVDSGDVDEGRASATAEASVATSGRWSAFIDAAEAECGGTPAGFEVDSATLSVEVLNGLIEVDGLFAGPVSLLLSDRPLGDPGAVVVTVAATASVGDWLDASASLEVTADAGDLEPLYDALLAGTFYAGLTGDLAISLGPLTVVDASFDVQVRALCAD